MKAQNSVAYNKIDVIWASFCRYLLLFVCTPKDGAAYTYEKHKTVHSVTIKTTKKRKLNKTKKHSAFLVYPRLLNFVTVFC